MRLCVNVDYLLILYDFFIEGLPKKDESNGRENQVDFGINEDEILQMSQRVFCDVKIVNPQFILYENQFDISKSNSLIIDCLINFRISLANKKTKIHTSLNDFMIRLKSVKTRRVLKRKNYLVLSPTSATLSGVIEEDSSNKNLDLRSVDDFDKKSQSFILDLQDILLNLSPQMLSTSLKMLNSIQNSLNEVFLQFLRKKNYFLKF